MSNERKYYAEFLKFYLEKDVFVIFLTYGHEKWVLSTFDGGLSRSVINQSYFPKKASRPDPYHF